VSTDSAIDDVIRRSRSKTTKARMGNANKRRLSKNPNKQAVELRSAWFAEYQRKFGLVPSKWGFKEHYYAEQMCDEDGVDESIGLITVFIADWDKRSFDGTPSIALCYAVRDRLKAEIAGVSKSKRDGLMTDEFQGRPEDPTEGW